MFNIDAYLGDTQSDPGLGGAWYFHPDSHRPASWDQSRLRHAEYVDVSFAPSGPCLASPCPLYSHLHPAMYYICARKGASDSAEINLQPVCWCRLLSQDPNLLQTSSARLSENHTWEALHQLCGLVLSVGGRTIGRSGSRKRDAFFDACRPVPPSAAMVAWAQPVPVLFPCKCRRNEIRCCRGSTVKVRWGTQARAGQGTFSPLSSPSPTSLQADEIQFNGEPVHCRHFCGLIRRVQARSFAFAPLRLGGLVPVLVPLRGTRRQRLLQSTEGSQPLLPLCRGYLASRPYPQQK
ncbi:hypothetical protein F5Y15DRAFT_45117 [Xylariaceae sp. FL0016]|nr:hypothetical protein F5Y15DRAFT_45117 [Xylariaceae sp. FL0016]